ncbi:MAG: aspartate dehydrogenase [Thermoplasmatales archaeon]|nr:aspartate dehydrogenase [Thermoplasmatales archaeon]
MRITIVGCGVIGSKLAIAADAMDDVKRIYLVDIKKGKAEALEKKLNKAIVVNSVEEELYHCDLVIEAASQEAAREIMSKSVGRGVDIMVMSVGALVDDEFRDLMFERARNNGCRIYIPSGAVCGTDGLRAAHVDELESVELITTKGPKSLAHIAFFEEKGIDVDKIEEKTIVYTGTAREAVALFPKNVNVAATVSLLGIGFDKTVVKVVLDPKAKSNHHELRLKGAFGEMACNTFNVPSPDNPKTSHLASLSAISALKRIVRNEWIGI